MQVKSRCIAFVTLLLPPSRLKSWLLRQMLGYENSVSSDVLIQKEKANIQYLSRISRLLWVVLSTHDGIGNQNTTIRGKRGVTWRRVMFRLGMWSKITVGHLVDRTRSIEIGDYAMLAGCAGLYRMYRYPRATEGQSRALINGCIDIGDKVCIRSACVLRADVRISDAITVGAAFFVSRSLELLGMYVSQLLRYVGMDHLQVQYRYPDLKAKGLIERVVSKRLSAKSR